MSGNDSAVAEQSAEAQSSVDADASEQTESVNSKADIPKTKKATDQKAEPYVNKDRFKTGGPPREKLSVDELTERMEHIREKNEKIKQRRLAVQADEEAFQLSEEEERQKQSQNKQLQESINKNREVNAQRKMSKMSNREWDSGKQKALSRKPKTTSKILINKNNEDSQVSEQTSAIKSSEEETTQTITGSQ